MADAVLVRVPTEWKSEFEAFWKDLRISEGLNPDSDLKDPEIVDRFDGAALVEWALDASPVLSPVLSATLGFLIRRRGEIEIRRGDQVVKFRNLTPKQIKEVISALDGASHGRSQ